MTYTLRAPVLKNRFVERWIDYRLPIFTERCSRRSPTRIFEILRTLPRGNRRESIQSEGVLPFINLRSGIDVYAHWAGKTLAEERAQITGHSMAMSVTLGKLMMVNRTRSNSWFPRRSRVMRKFPQHYCAPRLAEVLRIAAQRQATVYHRTIDDEAAKEALKSFADFVDLCERKEGETGKPCRISARY